MPSLLQCPGCARHMRVNENACPFCSVTISDEDRAGVVTSPAFSDGASRSTRRALRAALLAGAATLVGSGCGPAKDAKSGGGGDGNVLVQGEETEEQRQAREERELLEAQERDRNRNREPDMPYGCMWPDDSDAIAV